jgi:hypothetical protein
MKFHPHKLGLDECIGDRSFDKILIHVQMFERDELFLALMGNPHSYEERRRR